MRLGAVNNEYKYRTTDCSVEVLKHCTSDRLQALRPFSCQAQKMDNVIREALKCLLTAADFDPVHACRASKS